MMDLFQHRYYKINKMFLSTLGLWPYQPRGERYARTTFFAILVMSQVIPQIIAVVKFSDNPEIIIQSISPFVTDLACITKGVNIMFNINKMFKLLEHMRIDWMSLVNEPEIDILHDYAQVGRKFTVAYTTGGFICLAIFMIQPAAPKMLESLGFINGSGPGKLPFPMHYYGVDTEDHYYYMFIHVSIVSAIGVMTIISADTLFIVYVQHACGMFTVVGHQLKRMADKTRKDHNVPSQPEDAVDFQYVVICIKKHKEAIELGDLIEASHTWAFFSIVGFNMVMMSVTGYQMVVRMESDPTEAARFATFTVGQMLHLFSQSFFSQQLKDHSERIREYVNQAEWHSTSLYAQKLLNLVIMRTNVPCQLTAGKFLAMSMENFTSIVKTSMSYFTLLRSMQ